jgi:hypothetical protein
MNQLPNNNSVFESVVQPTPVTIEHEAGDVVVIEGVKYAGDFFRTNFMPNNEVLYAIRKDEDGVVRVTVIKNPGEAQDFFLEVWSQGELIANEGGS